MATADSKKTDETKSAKAAAAKKVYKVLSPLSHDNEPYKIGDPVELTDKEAEPLLGTVVEATE